MKIIQQPEAAAKPAAPHVVFGNVPEDLRSSPRWVVWKYIPEVDPDTEETDWDKPPYNAQTGGLASSTNPKTWSACADASAAYGRGGWDGIGYVLHCKPGEEEAEGIVAIDLDDCRDPKTNAIEPWALDIIQRLNSYTEVSPSGRGIRIFARGFLPKAGRKRGKFECYQTGRYRAGGAKNGAKFRRLWAGDRAGYGSPSEADLALTNHLAFWCGPDEGRIAELFAQSGLFRSKWQREDYRRRTIEKALAGRTEYYNPVRRPSANGTHSGDSKPPDSPAAPALWEPPVPFADFPRPEFPVECLSAYCGNYVRALAEATQTPADLAAMLTLGAQGAALAKKFRVVARPGWVEPTNLCTVTILPSGNRKSAVFGAVMEPVQAFEREEVERLKPEAAEKASKHRMLEARLKNAEARAAKADDESQRAELEGKAKELARELGGLAVPATPQLVCDDTSAEKLSSLLAEQGGRILMASPEGTAFEIAKGRYSETPNFDVFLKGHAGDELRANRVNRPAERVEQPALSAALAVQPDVIAGLAEQASLRGRGFLARWLYAVPVSLVGRRRVRLVPVPDAVARLFRSKMLELWRLPGAVDDQGRPAAHLLPFSPEADDELKRFEEWLEPQLGEGGALGHLGDWPSKLAGAVVRLAGILHIVETVGTGGHWQAPVSKRTVEAAACIAEAFLVERRARRIHFSPVPRHRLAYHLCARRARRDPLQERARPEHG